MLPSAKHVLNGKNGSLKLKILRILCLAQYSIGILWWVWGGRCAFLMNLVLNILTKTMIVHQLCTDIQDQQKKCCGTSKTVFTLVPRLRQKVLNGSMSTWQAWGKGVLCLFSRHSLLLQILHFMIWYPPLHLHIFYYQPRYHTDVVPPKCWSYGVLASVMLSIEHRELRLER